MTRAAEPMLPFSRARKATDQLAMVASVFDSQNQAGDGDFTRVAEELLSTYFAEQPTLLTSSCTGSLEMAAFLLDIVPGDEVIVPSFTFVSTANAFALRGAKLRYADLDLATLSPDPDSVAPLINERTKAVVTVHYGGVPCRLDELVDLCRSHRLPLIEDAAHSLFATWNGQPLGTFGSASTFSFHETKNISCGEGGALCVSDPNWVERAYVLREKGTNRRQFFAGIVDKYMWVDYGSSFLMSEMQAATLVAQLKEFEVSQAQRHQIWNAYREGLGAWAEKHGYATLQLPPEAQHPAHVFWLLAPDHDARTRAFHHLRDRNIIVTSHYIPLETTPMGIRFAAGDEAAPNSNSVASRILRLPLFADMTTKDIDRVIDTLTQLGR